MIGEAHYHDENELIGFFGYFYRFIEINTDDAWFDIDQHKKAEAEDLEQVKIPDNLRPNLIEVPYFFDVEKHYLYVLTSTTGVSLSASVVQRLLERLSAAPRITNRFETVETQVATEKAAVAELLDWPVLRRVEIMFERPNASDFEDEEEVFRYLEEQNLAREKRTYTKAPEAKSINPGEEMKQLARIAADNGRVAVSGVDPKHQSRTVNSLQFPWARKTPYDHNLQSLKGAFLAFVSDIRRR